MKADVGRTRYAREPLRKRLQGDAAEQRNLVGRRRSRARGARAEGWIARWFLRRQFLKADVGEARYAREPLRKRVQGDEAEQRNLVGPKQRDAGGRVREGRDPRVGELVDF